MIWYYKVIFEYFLKFIRMIFFFSRLINFLKTSHWLIKFSSLKNEKKKKEKKQKKCWDVFFSTLRSACKAATTTKKRIPLPEYIRKKKTVYEGENFVASSDIKSYNLWELKRSVTEKTAFYETKILCCEKRGKKIRKCIIKLKIYVFFFSAQGISLLAYLLAKKKRERRRLLRRRFVDGAKKRKRKKSFLNGSLNSYTYKGVAVASSSSFPSTTIRILMRWEGSSLHGEWIIKLFSLFFWKLWLSLINIIIKREL